MSSCRVRNRESSLEIFNISDFTGTSRLLVRCVAARLPRRFLWVNVWPEFMSRDAGHGLDLRHQCEARLPFALHDVAHRHVSDAQLASKLRLLDAALPEIFHKWFHAAFFSAGLKKWQ